MPNFSKEKPILHHAAMIHDKKIIAILTASAIVVGVVSWNVFSTSVSDIGKRFDAVGKQLEQTQQYQQSASQRLDAVQTTIDTSAHRISQVSAGLTANATRVVEVERRIETSEVGIKESQRIVDDCQRIIERVKAGRSK